MGPLANSLLFFALACTGFTGVDQSRVLGTIAGFAAEDPRIEITPTGRQVTVAVTTYGGGCDSQGETEVEVSGLEATVEPYDYAALPGSPCNRMLRSFRHATTVRFGRSGAARIVVRGLKAPSGDTLTVERSVLLQ